MAFQWTPTPAENHQTMLTNTLIGKQIAGYDQQEADAAYKRSPEYLNAQLLANRGPLQQTWNNSRLQAYNTVRNNITSAFNDAGMQGQEAPYLAALQSDYNALQYRPGAEASSSTYYEDAMVPLTRGNFVEEIYLAENPIAANAVANGVIGTGASHFINAGADSAGLQTKRPVQRTKTTPVGTDSWDDPGSLLAKDYGYNTAITNNRASKKQSAYTGAQQSSSDYIRGLGLDWDTGSDLITQAHNKLANTYATSGLSANDYTSIFDPMAVVKGTMDDARSTKRGQYTTQANTAFGAIRPEYDIADTADDSYINDIVGKSYTDAAASIDRARSRGALTDTGYSAGLGYLNDQKSSALSTANTLGGAVLERNRGTLGGIKSKALADAGGWDFGQKYDANSYLDQYNTKRDALSSGLGGEISGALAGQNWFDIGDVLTKSGYAQGAQNTAPLAEGFTTPAGLAALDNQRKKANEQRGIGGTSTF